MASVLPNPMDVRHPSLYPTHQRYPTGGFFPTSLITPVCPLQACVPALCLWVLHSAFGFRTLHLCDVSHASASNYHQYHGDSHLRLNLPSESLQIKIQVASQHIHLETSEKPQTQRIQSQTRVLLPQYWPFAWALHLTNGTCLCQVVQATRMEAMLNNCHLCGPSGQSIIKPGSLSSLNHS